MRSVHVDISRSVELGQIAAGIQPRDVTNSDALPQHLVVGRASHDDQLERGARRLAGQLRDRGADRGEALVRVGCAVRRDVEKQGRRVVNSQPAASRRGGSR